MFSAYLSKMLNRIYCLDITEIVLLFACGTGLFLFARVKCREKIWWRLGLLAGLLLWCGAVVYITVISREPGVALEYGALFQSYREVLAGGNPELLRSNFMNMVLFFPGGLLLGGLLPDRWPRWARMLIIAACFGGMSFAIEQFQYLRMVGNAEADDVLHNTLGAVLGAMCIKQYKESV